MPIVSLELIQALTVEGVLWPRGGRQSKPVGAAEAYGRRWGKSGGVGKPSGLGFVQKGKEVG